MFDALPEAFGSYRVIEAFGDGRFGPVYRARDDAARVEAAIKVFEQYLTSDQTARLAHMLDRLREAPLDHPALVPILAAGVDEDRAWLAEPWVDGATLDIVMRRDGAQPPADVLVRVTQLAGALDFAAAVDLHHGALHPRDILVAGDRTLLAGMGVVQALGDAGLVVPMEGAYVSPHRARGLPPILSDDIFSLAAITYELIYGVPLPATRSELRAVVEPLAGVDHNRLADVLERALSPEPDDRPSTALEFAASLQGALAPIQIPIQDSDWANPIPTLNSDSQIPISIPDSDSQIPIPTRDSEFHSEIPFRDSEVGSEPAVARLDSSHASVGDLPLRAADPQLDPGPSQNQIRHRNQNDDRIHTPNVTPALPRTQNRNPQSGSGSQSEWESEVPNRNRESQSEWESAIPNRNRESQTEWESAVPNRNRESESEYGYWFLTTATLAIGLLMGFASGYVVGQRDATPALQSTDRVEARAQRSPNRGNETPAPTVGRDFTESPVPPTASGSEPPSESAGVPPAASGREEPQDTPAASGRPDRGESGLLQVDSRPRGAQVFVDGRLVGTTPLLLSDVRPGPHAVRIDLRGHRRWVTSVDIAPGERERVAASLER